MDADLKALHRAVTDLLKARREAKRAAQSVRKAGGWRVGAAGWEGIHLIDQLNRNDERAQTALARAENEVSHQWVVFNRPPQSHRHESQRSPDDSEPDLERLP